MSRFLRVVAQNGQQTVENTLYRPTGCRPTKSKRRAGNRSLSFFPNGQRILMGGWKYNLAQQANLIFVQCPG